MAERKEGSGLRSYSPKANYIRAKLLAEFAAHPDTLLSRQDIVERFGVTLKSLEYAVALMKRDGHIKTLFGPNRTAYYVAASAPLTTPPKREKSVRAWPSASSYVAPRPIPNSIFSLAGTL